MSTCNRPEWRIPHVPANLEAALEGRRTTSPFTVLLVEDDANDAEFLKHAFRKIGFPDAVRVADSVNEATQYLEGNGAARDRTTHPLPTLILLDLKLPGKGGLPFLDWLRARPETKFVPVVVLTSSTDRRDMIEAYERGANSYTVKPVSLDEFVPMVQSIAYYWGTLNRIPE